MLKIFNYFSYYQWWKNLDKFILTLIITLFFIGLFFSLVSTSLIASDKLDTNSYFFFFKHLVFVFIGLFIIFVFSYINQKTLYKISIYIFLLSFILLFLVPIIGVEVKGSTRWLDLIFLPRLQPVELVKPFFIIMLALIISNKKLSNFTIKFVISFLLTCLIGSLLVLQPDDRLYSDHGYPRLQSRSEMIGEKPFDSNSKIKWFIIGLLISPIQSDFYTLIRIKLESMSLNQLFYTLAIPFTFL